MRGDEPALDAFRSTEDCRTTALMLVSLRDRLVRSRTQLTNAIRGHAAEFGVIASRGLDKIDLLLALIVTDESIPALARSLFAQLGAEFAATEARLKQINAELLDWHRQDEVSRRLAQIQALVRSAPRCWR